MINIDGMRCGVEGCDSRVTHDGDPSANLFVLPRSFERVRESMIRAHLVPHFMHDIVDIEVISHRDTIGRRGNSTPFVTVVTDATNTPGVSAAAGSAEHVANVVVSRSDY